MSDAQAEHNRATFSSANNDYLTDDAIHTRLDPTKLIERIEITLRGQVIERIRDHKTRQIIERTREIGRPLMNDIGIQHTIGFLNMLLGPQVVLGNLKEDEIELLVYEIHTGLSDIYIHNLNDWGINEDHYQMILLSLISTIRAYLSRTLNGFESTNLQTKISSVESNTVKEQGGKFLGGLFKSGT